MRIRRFVFALIFVWGLTGIVSAESNRSAQLIVRRAANFGTRMGLRIWIDGVPADAVAIGHEFRTQLNPGGHVISVGPVPNRWDLPPTSMPLRFRPGRTYQFTAMWRTDHIVLQ